MSVSILDIPSCTDVEVDLSPLSSTLDSSCCWFDCIGFSFVASSFVPVVSSASVLDISSCTDAFDVEVDLISLSSALDSFCSWFGCTCFPFRVSLFAIAASSFVPPSSIGNAASGSESGCLTDSLMSVSILDIPSCTDAFDVEVDLISLLPTLESFCCSFCCSSSNALIRSSR